MLEDISRKNNLSSNLILTQLFMCFSLIHSICNIGYQSFRIMSHLGPQYVSIRHCIHAIERSLYPADYAQLVIRRSILHRETWLRVVSVIHLDPHNADRRVSMVLNFFSLRDTISFIAIKTTSRTLNSQKYYIWKYYTFSEIL